MLWPGYQGLITPSSQGGPDLDLSIVIVNWNTRDLLLQCLASVYTTIRGLTFEVWLVDNASTDGSVAAAEERFPDLQVIRNPQNLGFAVANNLALRKARGRYALLLNTDALLTDGAVLTLFQFMERTPQAAMAGGQLLNLDGTRQNSIANFPSLALLLTNEALLQLLFPRKYPGKLRPVTSPIPVESCIGACILVRRTAMEAVGLLDERYFFFLEETDWARRMREAGWKIFFVPDARIFHAQGQSVGHETGSRQLFYRSRYQYFRKWYPRSYPVFHAAIIVRLLMNTLLTGLAVLATGGWVPNLRRRLRGYGQLVLWHLRGCPT